VACSSVGSATTLLRCLGFCSERSFSCFGLGRTFFCRGLGRIFFFRVLGLDDLEDVRPRFELPLINEDFERVLGLDFFL